MRHGAYYGSLKYAIEAAKVTLHKKGKLVKTNTWQGLNVTEAPQGETFELFDYSFNAQIPSSIGDLQKQTNPNLPWAEDHFQERVSGQPSNPGKEYMNWPFFKRQEANDQFRDEGGQHSHTYMERMSTPHIKGIRYDYGNLMDVVRLMIKDPNTRQAYLPVWFPEDTGAVHGERVPCTLGYHFIIRNGELNIFYPIRACDVYRHFQDDVYMAARLAMWMVDQLRIAEPVRFKDLKVGKLRMHIISFHIFSVEQKKLAREVGEIFEKRGTTDW